MPSRDALITMCWDLVSFETINSCPAFSFLRQLWPIQSSTVTIGNLEPILDMGIHSSAWRPPQDGSIGRKVQASIEMTIEGLTEVYSVRDKKSVELDEPSKGTGSSKVSTNVIFSPTSNMAFFQSVILFPLPSTENSSGQWELNMIMDIRNLELSRWRKTGAWHAATVGNVFSQNMAAAYHAESQVIAYSVAIEYTSRTDAGKFYFCSVLCLCELKTQVHRNNDTDERGTYLESEEYFLGACAHMHHQSYFSLGAVCCQC